MSKTTRNKKYKPKSVRIPVTGLRDHAMLVSEAQARMERAELDRHEVLDVMSGKLVMTQPIGDGFLHVDNVEWQLVREIK